jgi:hypothetical protein
MQMAWGKDIANMGASQFSAAEPGRKVTNITFLGQPAGGAHRSG